MTPKTKGILLTLASAAMISVTFIASKQALRTDAVGIYPDLVRHRIVVGAGISFCATETRPTDGITPTLKAVDTDWACQ